MKWKYRIVQKGEYRFEVQFKGSGLNGLFGLLGWMHLETRDNFSDARIVVKANLEDDKNKNIKGKIIEVFE